MENTTFNTKNIVTMALLVAIVLIMSTTPLGTLPIGPLSITLNMIPIAIAAITVGPIGGLVVGGVFGFYSFLQAMGIGVPSGMGMLTFSISPVLTFIQRFVSRAVTGYLLGYIFTGLRKIIGDRIAMFATGLCAALLNFIFFMGLLWLCFGSNPIFDEYLHNTIGKTSMIVYIVGTFASNTIFEIIVTTAFVGIIGMALKSARFIPDSVNVSFKSEK